MSVSLKRFEYLKMFQTLNHNKIRYQTPLILRMFGALNEINMRNENRYIICNFLDQYSDKIGLNNDIYEINNSKNLNQLLLLALNKARSTIWSEYYIMNILIPLMLLIQKNVFESFFNKLFDLKSNK